MFFELKKGPAELSLARVRARVSAPSGGLRGDSFVGSGPKSLIAIKISHLRLVFKKGRAGRRVRRDFGRGRYSQGRTADFR